MKKVDICVYGGTSAGVIAAYTARQAGKSVLLIEPGRHLGGMSSGGLGYTDIGNKYVIRGLALDFYRRLGRHYGKLEQWIFEPKEAEAVFNEYIRRAARQVPSVLLGGSLEGPNLYVTQCDERAAMRSAAARLMDSGCESILYLYNSLSFSSRNKLAGYREGCQLCGKPAPASHALLLDMYQFDVVQARDLLLRRWEEGLRFDAVLAADDRLAVGAAKFAKRQGLRVPEDLQIIGCNNSPIARYCDPELTSIDNQLGALCHQCVTTLMEVLAGKSSPTRTVFSAVLVERESTALKREED